MKYSKHTNTKKYLYLFLLLTSVIYELNASANNTRLSNHEMIYNEIFQLLTPYNMLDFEKVRLGNQVKDGGYIVPKELMLEIDRCYTYGVGSDISFERDLELINSKAIIRLYDHTVSYPKQISNNIFFKKEGIAATKKKNLNTLRNHIAENNDFNKKILLKIDTEGAEWDVLEKINMNIINDIFVFVIEIHWLHNTKKLEIYRTVLNKLNTTFSIFHIHGNNCGKIKSINGKAFPEVLEITYINNKYISQKEKCSTQLPMNLDKINCRPNDYILDFWLS